MANGLTKLGSMCSTWPKLQAQEIFCDRGKWIKVVKNLPPFVDPVERQAKELQQATSTNSYGLPNALQSAVIIRG